MPWLARTEKSTEMGNARQFLNKMVSFSIQNAFCYSGVLFRIEQGISNRAMKVNDWVDAAWLVVSLVHIAFVKKKGQKN